MAVTVLLSSHWHTLHNDVFPVFLYEDTLSGMALHSWCHVITLRGYSAPALTAEFLLCSIECTVLFVSCLYMKILRACTRTSTSKHTSTSECCCDRQAFDRVLLSAVRQHSGNGLSIQLVKK